MARRRRRFHLHCFPAPMVRLLDRRQRDKRRGRHGGSVGFVEAVDGGVRRRGGRILLQSLRFEPALRLPRRPKGLHGGHRAAGAGGGRFAHACGFIGYCVLPRLAQPRWHQAPCRVAGFHTISRGAAEALLDDAGGADVGRGGAAQGPSQRRASTPWHPLKRPPYLPAKVVSSYRDPRHGRIVARGGAALGGARRGGKARDQDSGLPNKAAPSRTQRPQTVSPVSSPLSSRAPQVPVGAVPRARRGAAERRLRRLRGVKSGGAASATRARREGAREAARAAASRSCGVERPDTPSSPKAAFSAAAFRRAHRRRVPLFCLSLFDPFVGPRILS
ncbi:hypothetical protein M885DRAFT_530018 [Pelagophyceae sp. CCMP2097]|nr:hypothetical protein M885DRAFT_530018 [Pelagophyceae sp. CCMP2097]